MPLTAAAIPQRCLVNRRSCEGAVCRNSVAKTDLDINHRSIQSDPGVCFDMNRRSDSSLISYSVMKKLEANLQTVVMLRQQTEKGDLYLNRAALDKPHSRGIGLIPPMYHLYPTQRCLYGLDAVNKTLPVERRRYRDHRRVYCLDSQLLEHKLSNQGRVISTSLSSSATSLYSDDGLVRSSVNPSPVPSVSECPSEISVSCRSSFCLEEKEEEQRNVSQKEMNNNEVSNRGVVKIDGSAILVNLKELRENSTSDQESSENCGIQESISTSFMPAILDKTTNESSSCPSKSREPLTDNEEDEYEQCAISEFWHLEEDGHRWSRMDSKASSVGTPTSRLSSSAGATRDGVREDSNGDVFASEGSMRVTSEDNHTSDSKHQQRLPQKQWMLPGNDDGGKPTHKVFKSKGNSFFKKFGSSFRKKEHMDRTTSMEGDIDSESVRSSKFRNDGRLKGWRKGRKPVIGEPVLQSGQDRFDQMKCVPLDGPASATKELQNQHRGRKNSSHSLISSSSSSGGASTASTPAFRTRASTDEFSDMGEISPGIHGRNRAILEMNISGTNVTLRNRETQQDRENSFYVIPRCYKPGTFPPTLREKSEQDELLASFPFPSASSTRSLSTSDSNQPASLQEAPKKLSRPMSIYDNLPDTALNGNASARDIINILDPGSPYGGVDDSGVYEGSMESLEPVVSGLDAAFWSVDDIVEHTQCLQQMVGSWDEEESADDRVDSIESNQADCLFPASAEVLPSYSSENISTAEDDAELNALPHGEHRTNCRLRWEVSNKEGANNMKHCEECLQLHTLSVGQLMILRRLSMLKLTALMESYAFSNNKGTLSWSVPRFIRRMKVPDYKDKSVFGVPLLQNVQRFGQPLPQCIQHALGHLRRTALDQVGLFRKPGVRSRIQKLRGRCESNPDLKNFDDCSAFDVADMVKQYFRELPDPLMTMKMSETFIGIFLYVPQDVRLQALQAATMLLPDETRETLKTLLLFLAEVASKSDENHMTASNLSTCFSPSLFYQQLNSARLMGSVATPKVRKSQGGKMAGIPLGKPDMNENKAANQCLGFMIRHVRELFKISEDAMTQCRMSVMQQTEDVLATEIGYTSDHHDEADYYTDFHSYVDRMVAQTIREEQRISQNKGGWQNIPSAPGSELMCKKINDGNPLRLWRSQVEATGADPNQIMDRILNERHLWDEDLLQWKVLQQPDERTQLFQIVQAEMSPHPTRDYCVLRSWRNGANSRGAVVVVETSTGMQALLGDVRGVILTSRYVIEPTDVPNKCTLTHVCRVDTKGRNPEWYNKAYGHIVTQRLLKIRDSIQMVPPKSQSFVG